MTGRDCDVWVALGREEFQWGSVPSDKQQFKIFFRPLPSGGYAEQCQWSKYSITPPPVNSYDEKDAWTGFGAPVYKDGAATVWIVTFTPWGQGWGASSKECTLDNAHGDWVVRRCDLGPMT